MKDKKKELLKILISRSIPVSHQTFEFTRNNNEAPSDQYIVDGPAFRDYLRSHRLNYKTIRKHRDWVPTFHLNGKKESPKFDEEDNIRQKNIREDASNRELTKFFVFIALTALAITLTFIL